MDRSAGGTLPNEEVGETLHWSDEEDELEALDGIKLPLFQLREEIAEYNATLQALEFQQTSDITASLGSRAHLERLTNQYWDLCVKIDIDEKARQREGEGDEDVIDETEAIYVVRKKLRSMILQHPSFRSSPLLNRWPLLAADVPKPTWTLGDEMIAVMEKHKRSIMENRDANGLEAAKVLPATLNCQHALLAVLQDLSRAGSLESSTKEREVITGWRDVFNCISKRHGIPLSVKEATRKRLEDIFGRVDYATPPSWMSTMGMGGQDKTSKFIKSEDISAPTQYHHAALSIVHLQKSNNSVNDFDKELLLGIANKKGRYLQPPPRIRLPQPNLSRKQVRERKRRRKERRDEKRRKSQEVVE